MWRSGREQESEVEAFAGSDCSGVVGESECLFEHTGAQTTD